MENLELIIKYNQLKKDLIEVINGYTNSGMPIFISKKAFDEISEAINIAAANEFKAAQEKMAETSENKENEDPEVNE